MHDFIVHAKRLDNGEWVEGNLFVPDKPDTPTQICIGTNIVRITYDVDPSTIGWYTGLTDKNGKKIFEGDIVKCKDNLVKDFEFYGYVDHFNGSFVIVGEFMTHYRWLDYELEVIGNIHDNPELLK